VWFVVLAAAVVIWFVAIFRWAFFHARPPIALTSIVLALGALSMAADARRIWHWYRAPRSNITIHAIDRGTWWELRYDDGVTRFTTANELHFTSGAILILNNRDMLFDRSETLARTLHLTADRHFDRWFRNEASPARAGTWLFMNAGCAYCHVVRGVAEHPWQIAPDLTHFASRTTMRRGELAGWIVDSRGLKKDSQMPPNRLDPRDLLAMLDYLESLR
jgi:hypothetical protein